MSKLLITHYSLLKSITCLTLPFIQVQKNYDVLSALAYFLMRRQNQPGELDKYRGMRLQVRDETGIILFDNMILEE